MQRAWYASFCLVSPSRPRLSMIQERLWRQRLKGDEPPRSLWATFAKLKSLVPFRAARRRPGTSKPGSHCKRRRDCQTSMCRAIPGRQAEALAGTCTPGIA